jgi:small nuclear ribonucleoprotein (snRNP)-like protein
MAVGQLLHLRAIRPVVIELYSGERLIGSLRTTNNYKDCIRDSAQAIRKN